MLGEGENVGEGANENDVTLPPFLSRVDLDPLDHGADDLNCLRARGLVLKKITKGADLAAVEIGEVGMGSPPRRPRNQP